MPYVAILAAPLQCAERAGNSEDRFAEFMRRRYARSELVVETSRKLGEWELAEFEGRPVAGANPTALMTEAGLKLAETY